MRAQPSSRPALLLLRAAITALLLLKYSVLLATISQRVKARRASKKEGKCDNEINPGPAGPGRARQAEHDVLQPPRPRGPAASPEGPRHPKSLWLPNLAELVASPAKRWRDMESIQSPAGRTEHPFIPQAAAKLEPGGAVG